MHFACKEMCRKHYIIEQISGSLHEIQLCHLYLIHIFQISDSLMGLNFGPIKLPCTQKILWLGLIN